jgi:hypothetical protein
MVMPESGTLAGVVAMSSAEAVVLSSFMPQLAIAAVPDVAPNILRNPRREICADDLSLECFMGISV